MRKLTIFQKLSKIFSGDTISNNYNISPRDGNDVMYTAKDEEEYEMKKKEARQRSLLAKEWRKASYDTSNRTLINLGDIKMMYRDADIMDNFPEIGTALDIVMEESTCMSDDGFMINISSKSNRIKSILEDLFINRLSINIQLPMICRSMCKYGNTFMLLNVDDKNGVTGWKTLPVYEVERFETGMENPYANAYVNLNNINDKDEPSTKFVWIGQESYIPYLNWQVAHFRLLYNSLYLPYGMSFLNKARRHFRMLSMMEDMMLIYRLERSIERRVFKINVGAIDEADIPAYVQQIADNFKRTPLVDPMTGQLDLRKDLLSVASDYFIPVREDNASNPIETLPAAQNLTAMDDIKFIQNKVFTALRVPKPFLNFEETQGDGKNLSLLDIRFSKTVNRIQQSLIMELNKVAMIHLILLGFSDDLTNFSITMNNPSSQAEMLELDNLAKKITTAKDAVSDPGNGIPLMSTTRALKTIMKWSDKEISDNLEELRLEKALAAELEKTSEIIKKTGIFDPVDNIYGEIGSKYSDTEENTQKNMGNEGTTGEGMFGGIDFGGGMEEENNELSGNEGEMSMGEASQEEETETQNGQNEETRENETHNQEGLGESYAIRNPREMNERKTRTSRKKTPNSSVLIEKLIKSHEKDKNGTSEEKQFTEKTLTLNEELNELCKELGKFMK